ncbi:hypothetical protein KAM481_33130 [Aeromonas caviae]|uniref:hypothetical protein n=1 Tax=Aeromonas caviae TaxID=648 RepID=UPI001FBB55AB|nr:hypothetical protein [Aeromonas caviae]BDO09025.1 hypothetical protein KAM643c_25980 [Aeromonas caviae]GKR79843.1 hypothetical protein KAM481_33130 [Aeromonas caviae]
MTNKKTKAPTVTAAALLNKLAYRHERVPAPEFGEGMEIIVREMPIAGLLEFQRRNFDQVTGQPLADNPYQWMVSLLVACMVNEDGEPLATQDDVPQLMDALPMSLVDRLIPVAKALNRMGEQATEQEKNGSAPATP